ncbi:anaerobic sulfatase maturase [Methanofollis fontis]|uniref:Anaerobic sulfatase maturase n=2 Tax=Methanofollis fontis TaxID=2052832 RepID=A0A483CVD8_9EURY|nr:anaerobic sulfatase maturase [Methanofollis fontis]
MAKPTGARCNLRCTYCFYLQKAGLYPDGTFRMSDAVLESYIRQVIDAHRSPLVTVAWQGGEPTLMGLDFFERAMEIQQRYRRGGTAIQNTIQTNGTLLDDSWAGFFRRHQFLVGISIDGPEEVHDAFRVDRAGRPTFGRAMTGLSLLRKHGVEHNILTCIHAANQERPLEVYRFLRDEAGGRHIQFIPVVERRGTAGVSVHSVGPEPFGRFLNTIFDEWVRHDVGSVFVQNFEAALAAWAGIPPGTCVSAPVCGTAPVLEHNGDVYVCDHYADPAHRLGNIMQTPLSNLMASPMRAAFGRSKLTGLPDYCRRCRVRFACNGGCPKDRFLTCPDGEAGLNYLCRGYRIFFTHIDAPMRFMAENLRRNGDPSDVMAWMRAKNARIR